MRLLAKCLPGPISQPLWSLKLLLINNTANIPTIPVPKDTNARTKIELQKPRGCATSSGDQIIEPRIIGSRFFFLFLNNEKSYRVQQSMACDLSHLAFGTSPRNRSSLQVVSALPYNPDLSLNFVRNLVLELLPHWQGHMVIWERRGPGIEVLK